MGWKFWLIGAPAALLCCGVLGAQQAPTCKRTIYANVVALDQVIMLNRLGSEIPGGMIYALARDVVDNSTASPVACDSASAHCQPGQVSLRSGKRPRPIVLRMGIGDCLAVNFTNLLTPSPSPDQLQLYQPAKKSAGTGILFGQTETRAAGFHVAGLDLLPVPGGSSSSPSCVPALPSDAAFAGSNCSSLASPGQTLTYRYYAREEGHYLVYSIDDAQGATGTAANAGQQEAGLFGSVTVEPKDAEFYRSQVTRDDLEAATYVACVQAHTTDCVGTDFSGSIPNMRLVPGPAGGNGGGSGASWNLEIRDRLGVVRTVAVVEGDNDRLFTVDGYPLINYQAVYQSADNDAQQPAGTPVLSMLQPVTDPASHAGAQFEIVHSDLTAIITGPDAGRFPDYQNSPLFAQNPALPDRREPFREFTVHYHMSNAVVQPFKEFSEGPLTDVLSSVQDSFGINYGMGGIGTEIMANRLKVGPEAACVECKFEEFFLSSWAVGDPAMLVDHPAGGNTVLPGTHKFEPIVRATERRILPGQRDPSNETLPAQTGMSGIVLPEIPGTGKAMTSQMKATMAFYPDDPSNVYHSYMRDHVKFRISNVSVGQPHVHHQHAHQWLQTPDNDNSAYLDSQMIVPGATYTLEMVYNGSGNRNQTVGDSIFHCHFYPHFAAGMWSLWRVHDVFEDGTILNKDGSVAQGDWNRALPDGEIVTGTPIPAVVPLPTLGMAPLAAKVKLVDNGTRAIVKPNADGSFSNPGYPFFVPGVAGHRAPHPPLDFAWEEKQPGVPELDKNGHKKPLDGGLPRHLILGGQIVREFHTRWDFSKDTIARDANGKPIAGGLTAFVLPEDGTDVERAAMLAHSQRSFATPEPDGHMGTFYENGLPPAPGAPFARPDVDDNGNSVTKLRRYQAAVIQTDVVLNKDGWHYPQQRLITLWNDVAPTLSGQRPPEPLFFRANSGETVEFWHTNLVPSYYQLDDFQVRTPTDIIGQHIHLVKFDVLASDGAANGFNYEDGTFSPDEVRDRIDAINLYQGLYEGTENAQEDYPQIEACLNGSAPLLQCLKSVQQQTLTAKPAPTVFGPAPLDTSWVGAQTTIQRWETDPLLNNAGKDRTMRTVFTHDHFGPSTHQNIGLYAGLLIEPPGSSWSDSTTGAQMGIRSDGGPTSWQAIITPQNSDESYREFALEFQDLQLAYTATSRSQAATPTAPLFVQTVPAAEFASDVIALQLGTVPPSITNLLGSNGIATSGQAKAASCPNFQWCITDSTNYPGYTLGLKSDNNLDAFELFTPDMPAGWADTANALSPPAPDPYPSNLNGPYPQTIDTSPGTGTYSLNYRNEPVPLRVNTKPDSTGHQTDLAWAFASLGNRDDSKMNTQPQGFINGSSGFSWPQNPLVPGMQGPDPFTPLLRAYENDRVQIRTLVGAHVNTHAFLVQGADWLYEPDVADSGYKSLQGMGLSEHFELNFQIPSPIKLPGTQFSDYLYAPSSSISGTTQGLWGLMRGYDGSQGLQSDLQTLPNNPQGHVKPPATTASLTACPANRKPDVQYHVYATTPSLLALPQGAIVYNTHGSTALAAPNALLYVNATDVNPTTFQWTGSGSPEPLILRAHAGDCIAVTLTNLIPASDAIAQNKLGKPFDGGTQQIFRFYISDADVQKLNANPSQMLPAFQAEFAQNNYTITNAQIAVATAGTSWTVTANVAPTGSTGTGNPIAFTLSLAQNVIGVAAPDLSNFTAPTPSATVGLHAGEVAYNVRLGDGENVGFNQLPKGSAPLAAATADPAQNGHQGGSVTMQWYAGNVWQQEDGTPVQMPIEFGSIPLLPADRLFQASNGLVGALIIEPPGATITQDPGTHASATVTLPRSNGKAESFREFVVVMQDGLAGVNGNNVTAYQATSGVNYRSEPKGTRYPPQAGAFMIGLPPDTTPVASYIDALDGCDQNAAPACLANSPLEAVFQTHATTLGPKLSFTLIDAATSATTSGKWAIQDGSNSYTVNFVSGRLQLSNSTNPNIGSLNATSQLLEGLDLDQAQNLTALFALGNISASAQVTQDAQARAWSITNGLYSFNVSGNGNSPVNQIPLPLQVTYSVNTPDNPVLLDFTTYLSNSNSQNPRWPDTPTFCASAGQPMRFRVVLPGTDSDQVLEIHGHSWEQEPYTHDGRSIGRNPTSQQMGTQVISPNDRLDIVLPKAGGPAAQPGDYLYHAFMYQLSGIWGLLHVVPSGQDPVQACQNLPPANALPTSASLTAR